MLRMRWVLLFGLLAVLCLSTVTAEDPKAEPESEPEAEAEPKADEDNKQAGSSVAGKQRGTLQKINNRINSIFLWGIKI